MEDPADLTPAPPASCARCGRVAPATAPATWSVVVERGRRSHLCERCSREHLRAIEARLDPEHW